MSEETISEIRADYGAEQTRVIHAFGDRVDEIASRGSDSLANREYSQYGQVEQILIDAKQSEVEAEAVETCAQLREAHDRYEKRLAKRAEAVRSELFGNIEDTAAFARAATATEAEIREMMDLANFTGNKELGKVAFTVAARKGHGNLINTYLNEIDGDARELFEEWTQIPTPEQLTRQRQNLDRLIAVPDRARLVPRPRVR